MLENFENGNYKVGIVKIETSSVTYNGEARTRISYMLLPQNEELRDDLYETQTERGIWKLYFKFTARSDDDLYKHFNGFVSENFTPDEIKEYEKIKGSTPATIINFLNDCLTKTAHITVASIVKDSYQNKPYYRVRNIVSEKKREANKQCEAMSRKNFFEKFFN